MGVSSAESKRETSIIPLPPSLNLSPPAALKAPAAAIFKGRSQRESCSSAVFPYGMNRFLRECRGLAMRISVRPPGDRKCTCDVCKIVISRPNPPWAKICCIFWDPIPLHPPRTLYVAHCEDGPTRCPHARSSWA